MSAMEKFEDEFVDDLRDQVKELEEKIDDLQRRIGDASILMADWDGYYDPKSECGNAKELAMLIEDAFKILQGKSWRNN